METKLMGSESGRLKPEPQEIRGRGSSRGLEEVAREIARKAGERRSPRSEERAHREEQGSAAFRAAEKLGRQKWGR